MLNPMNLELRQRIEELKAGGLAIRAIALVRRELGSTLAEAKAIVDSVDVSLRLPEARTIWMTPSRQGFFSIPEDADPPTGRVRLVTPDGRTRRIALDHLGRYSIPHHVARAVLGAEATEPGRSAKARAHRARLDPSVSSREWAERLEQLAAPWLSEWQRSELRTFMDVGETTLAVEMVGAWQEDSEEPWPDDLTELTSNALVACGREPLDDAD